MGSISELLTGNSLHKEILTTAGNLASDENLPAFVVGGYVRDMLIGRVSNDIDIMVEGDGIAFAKKLAKRLKVNITVDYEKFGTALIPHPELEIEVASARKEEYQSDSRKPSVTTTTVEEDMARRDFTINAMAISLNFSTYGELIDPFTGISDLETKTIKTPLNPDVTYSDDPLRMMRAIRFASQLNFEIEDESYSSICKNADRLSIISKERIAEELNKILLSKKPSIGLKLLFNTKLLHQFFPEMVELQGVEERGKFAHKDNFYHTLEVIDNIRENTDNIWLIWAALLHDIAKPQCKRFEEGHGWTFHGHEFLGGKMVSRIFKTLKLPLNEKMKYVKKLVTLHLRPIVLSQDMVTDSAIRRLLFDAGDDIDDLMTLCEADITSKNPKKVSRYIKNFKLVRKKLKEIEEKDHIRNWQPPISGEEIMKIFNIEAGREVGILKNSLKDAILDGKVKNEKEAALSPA